jgi:predicted ATPase
VESFLRSVCTKSHPIILFLDDLQWADQASLEIFRSITTDTELRHLLLVGAHSDEVDEASHPLAIVLEEIEAGKRSITKIFIEDLSIETVTKLISGLLRLDEMRVAELTEVVHQRTGGNPFFVQQFLAMLQKNNMLAYSLIRYEWSWDIDEIRSETQIADNVVEFVALKIQGLPPHIATVLKLMACFPSNLVEVDLLESILRGLDEGEFRIVSESFNLVEILEEASQEALVDRIGTDSFKFMHDRVREAAYSLIPLGRERDTFHLRIGQVVMKLLSVEPRRQSLKFVQQIS